MSLKKHHTLVAILPMFVILTIACGCRSAKQAISGEGFFRPLTSVNRPAAPKPPAVADAPKPSAWDQLADSLLRRQKQQDQRIEALKGQLRRLETLRKGHEKTDYSGATRKQAEKVSLPDGQPTTVRFREFVRLYEAGQYKAASEGFRGLLHGGVPKDVEDQYHYMIGMSHFKLKEFDLALSSLRLVASWRGSTLRADAYFALGQIYKQLGVTYQAKAMFEAALRGSTKAELAKAARKELNKLAVKK